MTLEEQIKRVVATAIRDVLATQLGDLRRDDLDDTLLDVGDAAKLLRMSEAAVRTAARRGALPVRHIGSRLRFRRSELLAIAKRGEDDER